MRRALLSAFILALFWSFAPPLHAASASASMSVSAVVLARAIVHVNGAVGAVEVTDQDRRAGYVDVALPLLITARTNSPRGYVLHISNDSTDFAVAELRGDAFSLEVANDGAVERPYVAGGETVSCRIRLRLATSTLAGSYAFPVAVTAVPLT